MMIMDQPMKYRKQLMGRKQLVMRIIFRGPNRNRRDC